jgi:MFS family permease
MAIAVLGAMPFAGHVLQLPAAALTARFGARRVALAAVAISRQAYLPLVVVPFLPVPLPAARALLLGAAAVHQGVGIVCNNGWVAWMGEIVPPRVRGRYFGRRTAIATLAAALSGIGVGALLDRAPGGRAATLSALAVLTCLTGALSTVLMARQHGGLSRSARARRAAFAAVLDVRAPRRWAKLQAVCGLASGLAVPFFGVFVLRDRGLGFAFLAAYGAVGALARMVAAPAWGRRMDRQRGARSVVVAGNAIAVAGPLLWIASARAGAGLLLVEGALGGIAAAATNVAGLVVPLSLSDDATRPVYSAVFAVAGGLAFAGGAAAGAALSGALPESAIAGPLTVPFAACAALRIAAVGLSVRIPVAPEA